MESDKNYFFKGLIFLLFSVYAVFSLNYLKLLTDTQDNNVQWIFSIGGLSSIIYFILAIKEYYNVPSQKF